MRVSIVIVTRNRDLLLQRAIDSIIAQDYRPVDLVIVDNASDEPVQIHTADLPTQIHRNAQMLCASQNRNRGIDMATGSVVCFIDDDDFYLPGKLSKLIALVKDHNVAYGNTRMLGPGGQQLGVCAGPPHLPKLMQGRYMHLNSIMIRRSVLDTTRFDDKMTTYEDVDFVFRLVREHGAAHCNEILAVWNRDDRPDQLTRKNWGRARRNWLILCERFSTEINAHPVLAKLYYKKMLLLSAMRLRPLDTLRFTARYLRFGFL